MRHPTPLEIKVEITRALLDDINKHPLSDTSVWPMPVRVHSLIDTAISRACEKAEENAA